MNKFFVLLKKEIKELITIQVILPLIITALIFGLVGNIMSKETAKLAAPQPVLILNQDTQASADKIAEILKNSNFSPAVISGVDIEYALSEMKKNNTSSLLVIPRDFLKNINNFNPQQISVYKIAESFSLTASTKYVGLDRAITIINSYYSDEWIQRENIDIAPEAFKNPVRTNEFVVIKDKKANIPMSLILGFVQKQVNFIPIVLFIMIIMAAQMVAMAVANEKENKTFEILLSSPIDRKTIIFAKLIAAGLVSLIIAAVYMIGFNYYMKGIIGASPTMSPETIQVFQNLGIVITPVGYLFLGLSLFMAILVALSIAMILGIMAESVKSVQAVITPLMIIVLLPYFIVLFLDINSVSPLVRYLVYAIPFSHPFLASQNIILGNYASIIYGIIYQFVVFVIFVVIGAKIFSSDKVVTMKLNFRKKRK